MLIASLLLSVIQLSHFSYFHSIFAFYNQSSKSKYVVSQIEAENHCTSQIRSLIDQISLQQGRILDLQQEKNRLEQECNQIKSLVQDLESMLSSLHSV